jgi:hypothetical protein
MKTIPFLNGGVLATTFFIAANLFAQPTTFEKTFGGANFDVGFCISNTPDGGFIISGQTKSLSDTLGDSYLVKLDSFGEKEWERSYGGRWLDGGNSIVPTKDGGYFITNHTQSYGSGECDSWVYKTGDVGNMMWEQVYGSSRDDAGYQGIQTSTGEFVVTGVTILKPDTLGDAFIAKYAEDGEPLWVHSYGGDNAQLGERIAEAQDGGYVVAGITTNNSNGPEDMYVFKTDANGKLLWSKNIGGKGYDEAQALIATEDGGYLVGGFSTSFGTSEDCYLVKLDGSGNILWSRIYGGDKEERIASITGSGDGGFVFTGYTQSFGDTLGDVLVIKTDAYGNQLWLKTFGGEKEEKGAWIVRARDGGYAITGKTMSKGNGDADVYLIKINDEGEINLGIAEVDKTGQFALTPNPAHKTFTFKQEGIPSQLCLTLFDLSGNMMQRENISAQVMDVEISELSSGIYYYTISNDKAKIVGRGKLIVN